MAHIIEAIVLKGTYDEQEAAKYDLHGTDLGYNLTLFFIDDRYTTYWQKKLDISGQLETNNEFPNEKVLFELMHRIAKRDPVEFAVIATAYVGGLGTQYANVYVNQKNVDLSINTINLALNYLGVTAQGEDDEFDVVRLGRFRKNPTYLDKYEDLTCT